MKVLVAHLMDDTTEPIWLSQPPLSPSPPASSQSNMEEELFFSSIRSNSLSLSRRPIIRGASTHRDLPFLLAFITQELLALGFWLAIVSTKQSLSKYNRISDTLILSSLVGGGVLGGTVRHKYFRVYFRAHL